MKKIFIIIILIFGIKNISFASNSESFSNENSYNLYESKYFIDFFSKKPSGVSNGEELKIAQNEYKKNMDAIYDCATLGVYLKSLKTIKEDLIKKNPKLNSRLKSRIEQKINEIKGKMNEIKEGKCKTNPSGKGASKLSVLKQVTYETCKYNFYLEYLKGYNKNIKNLAGKKESSTIKEINEKSSQRINAIDTEIEKTYKVFPIAFQAYSDYENHIGNHILLELLEEDYKLLRIGIHKTLNPINQVIYKISNAMRQ